MTRELNKATAAAETTLSPDGATIRIFIPAKLGRHAGRKLILSPEGGPVNGDRTDSFDATLVNALVRAHRWNRWLETGKYADIKELAAAEGITSPSYASRILRLVLMAEIERVWQANLRVYGADKVWKQLNREGVPVARCTVERLMGQLGLQGARRGKTVRTTVPDPSTPCPLDRVNREFKADRPNRLWVSDFTYVSTWQGWLYVAFIIDVFARRIVGWRVSTTMTTDFVLDALEQALYARQPGHSDTLVHHSDRGSQYVSIRYTERLAEAGIEPSVGSRGDSYDNALAETINGLFKAEVIHRRGPWKTRESVELATLEWVAWYNHERLMQPLGYIPPAEAEANYYQQLNRQAAMAA